MSLILDMMSAPKRPRENAPSVLSNDLDSAGSLSLSNSEILLPIIQQYAIQRRYDTSWKNKKFQTPLDVAIRGVLETRSSSSNAFIFLPHVIDPNSIDQQFARVRAWVLESPESMRLELIQLLFPIFTHFYLELVSSGHKLIASKFFKKYQSSFLGSSEFSGLLRLISNILTPEELMDDSHVFSYYSKKYRVFLSDPVHIYFMRLLQKDASLVPLVLHILNNKLDVHIGALKNITSVEDARALCHKDDLSTEASAPVCTIQQKLFELREGAKNLPSILLYSISNEASNLTSSAIFLDGSLMAVGDDNSSIQLWRLIKHDLQTHGPCQKRENDASSVGLDARQITQNLESYKPESTSHHRMLLGHSGPVYGLCFSPRVNILLSVSADTTMRAWDTVTGVNRALYRGHSYPIWALDVDNMGWNIATGSMDNTARLWNLEYNFPIRLYCGHEDDVEVVRFHPNGELLGTGSSDQIIKIWQHVNAKPTCALMGHKGSINALAFSLDGRLLASGGVDHKVRVWDLRTLKLFEEFMGHSEMVDKLAWNADGSILASGGRDGTVRLWNVDQNKSSLSNGPLSNCKATQSDNLPFYSTPCSNILDLCYSPHNNLVVTGDCKRNLESNVKVESIVNGLQS